MSNKALMLYIKTQNKLNSAKEAAQKDVEHFLHDEEGDTNFLSIIILLGIALALAAVFIAFKDKILGWFHTNADGFLNTSGGDSNPGDWQSPT